MRRFSETFWALASKSNSRWRSACWEAIGDVVDYVDFARNSETAVFQRGQIRSGSLRGELDLDFGSGCPSHLRISLSAKMVAIAYVVLENPPSTIMISPVTKRLLNMRLIMVAATSSAVQQRLSGV